MMRRRAYYVLTVLTGLLLFFPVGCGEQPGDAVPGTDEEMAEDQAGQLLPPEDIVEIVLEAQDGEVTPLMEIEEFEPFTHPEAGPQEASGGLCVVVPKHANREREAENQKRREEGKSPLPHEGKLVLTFEVPEDDEYYIWPRVMWGEDGGCENSVGFRVNDGSELVLTSGTYMTWLWFKVPPLDHRSDLPRAYRLDAGEHTITFTNVEDNIRIDQVYITNDPYAAPPSGQIMELVEPDDFSF